MRDLCLLILIAMVFTISGCFVKPEVNSRLTFMTEQNGNEIKAIPLDETYINWLKSCSHKTRHWDSCVRVNKNGEVKEYYSNLIFFAGEITEDGIKTGVWRGYFRNKVIVETAYLGIGDNVPVLVEIWDDYGKLIRYSYFGVFPRLYESQ